jgi:stage II sporulation protein P
MKFKNLSALNRSLLILVVVVLMFLALPTFVLGAGSINAGGGSTKLIEALYYSFPFMKVVNNSKSDMPSDGDFKDKMLYLIGINVADPLSVIGKEIAYLNAEPGSFREESAAKSDEVLQPYRLSDEEITLDNSDDSANDGNSNDTSDLPNRLVSVYDPKLKKTINKSKPEVLIYHTHTSESYMPVESGFSLDEKYSVCGVGDVLKNELENNYGISVIDDKTVNDTNYLQSYTKSAMTVDKYLKKYKDFKLIIDMHRDASANKRANTTKMNGEDVAKIMFVTTTSSPRYKKNIAIVNKLMDISNKLFPGYCRGIYTYAHGVNSFNQNKSDNAVLIEVGVNINTSDEAKASAKYIARIIGEYINGKN